MQEKKVSNKFAFEKAERRESTITEYRKGQIVRLVDVFVIGPICIYAGAKYKNMPVWLRSSLIIIGAATVYYNAKNWLVNWNQDGQLIREAMNYRASKAAKEKEVNKSEEELKQEVDKINKTDTENKTEVKKQETEITSAKEPAPTVETNEEAKATPIIKLNPESNGTTGKSGTGKSAATAAKKSAATTHPKRTGRKSVKSA